MSVSDFPFLPPQLFVSPSRRAQPSKLLSLSITDTHTTSHFVPSLSLVKKRSQPHQKHTNVQIGRTTWIRSSSSSRIHERIEFGRQNCYHIYLNPKLVKGRDQRE
ncbi:hypothetical protein MUK42_13788 [Musa troglodytarum]|uniref:Uncharacterized protein n=1 Tax=Musa troglodytarum TaxID=320322 RepID=A0A9E7LFK8_9LILI|nr:hypothetical protein MUK42_13788 [Musa troglodytarum]URE49043.1 hypothetical protein MUK42_13788 [Musa troglodytarum]